MMTVTDPGIAAACNHDLLSQEQETSLFVALEKAADTRRPEIINIIISHNCRLVLSIAQHAHGLPLPDAFQEGIIGLIEAIKRFDYRRGNRFSTCAHWWIRQAIGRAVANQSRMIRLPVWQYDLDRKARAIRDRLTAENGQEPTIEELAQVLEVKADHLQEVLEAGQETLSLDQPPDNDDMQDGYDFFPVFDEEIEDPYLKAKIWEALETLTPREQIIIELRFGFRGDEGAMKLQPIADKFGLTRERIRQIEAGALRKLKVYFENGGIDEHNI